MECNCLNVAWDGMSFVSNGSSFGRAANTFLYFAPILFSTFGISELIAVPVQPALPAGAHGFESSRHMPSGENKAMANRIAIRSVEEDILGIVDSI